MPTRHSSVVTPCETNMQLVSACKSEHASAAQALHATQWEDAIVWGDPSEDEAAPDALAGSQPRSPDDAEADDGDDGSTRSAQTTTVPAAPASAADGQNGVVAPMDWAAASVDLSSHRPLIGAFVPERTHPQTVQ